jgi:hypothetical protein
MFYAVYQIVVAFGGLPVCATIELFWLLHAQRAVAQIS